MNLFSYLRTVPDFPKPGIMFYDISPLLADKDAWRFTIKSLADKISPYKPDAIVGIESRGFLLAAPLALEMGLGFVMVRKSGKLPGKTERLDYALEYGEASLEIQQDIIGPNKRVAVVDDILATGGTMRAALQLLRQAGAAPVCSAFLMELQALNGREKLSGPIEALLTA